MRINVGYRAVAVPLEELEIRILLHQIVHHTEHEVLYLWIGHIEHQLIAEVISVAIWQTQYPVGMFLGQLTLRIDHLRLYPYTEFHTFLVGSLHQIRHTVGQFLFGNLPVAQSGSVVGTRIFVAEPSVIEQEQIDAKVACFVKERCELGLIEVEEGVLPVVEQSHTVLLALEQLMIERPACETAAALTHSFGAEGKYEFGSDKHLAALQTIERRVGIDTAQNAQRTVMVHLKRKSEITGPGYCTHEHSTLVLACRSIEAQFEERLHSHGRTCAEAAVEYLLTVVELRVLHLHLLRPVAAEFCQIILLTLEIEHGRSVARKIHSALLVVAYLGPLLYDVLLCISHIVQSDIHRIDFVLQSDDSLSAAVGGALFVRHVLQHCGRIAVGMAYSHRGVIIILHTHHRIGFESGNVAVGGFGPRLVQIVEIGVGRKSFAQIGLIQTTVVLHLQHELGVVCGHRNVGASVRRGISRNGKDK